MSIKYVRFELSSDAGYFGSRPVKRLKEALRVEGENDGLRMSMVPARRLLDMSMRTRPGMRLIEAGSSTSRFDATNR